MTCQQLAELLQPAADDGKETVVPPHSRHTSMSLGRRRYLLGLTTGRQGL